MDNASNYVARPRGGRHVWETDVHPSWDVSANGERPDPKAWLPASDLSRRSSSMVFVVGAMLVAIFVLGGRCRRTIRQRTTHADPTLARLHQVVLAASTADRNTTFGLPSRIVKCDGLKSDSPGPSLSQPILCFLFCRARREGSTCCISGSVLIRASSSQSSGSARR